MSEATVICRYCNQPIDPGKELPTFAYWDSAPIEQRVTYYCHAECKEPGRMAEAYDCQLIDADCNDCRHFKRGQVEKRWLSCVENKKPSMCLVNMGYVHGHCLKFDRYTTASPNKWTGMECFEHRRSPTTP